MAFHIRVFTGSLILLVLGVCRPAQADVVTLQLGGDESGDALVYNMAGTLCDLPQNVCTMTGTLVINNTLGTVLSEDFSGDINGVTMTCAGTSGSVGGNFDLDVPYNTELGTPCALFGIETPTEASLVGYLGSLIDGGSSQNSVAYFDNGNDAGLIATGAYFEAIAEPEPPSLAILLIGIAVLTFGFRRKNRSLLGC